MKQNTVQKEEFFDSDRKSELAQDPSSSSGLPSYARALRMLGIILEQHRFSVFDLRVEKDTCVVKGIAQRAEMNSSSVLQHIRDLFGGAAKSSRADGGTIKLELSFSMAEIDAMETKVQEQRHEVSKMPDPYCLSQILRGVGCYLDTRNGSELIGVTLKDRWVTMAYRTSDGRIERTHQDFEYFYNYSVKMYMHRSSREKLPPLSDPTLIVTWEDRQKTHMLSQPTK